MTTHHDSLLDSFNFRPSYVVTFCLWVCKATEQASTLSLWDLVCGPFFVHTILVLLPFLKCFLFLTHSPGASFSCQIVQGNTFADLLFTLEKNLWSRLSHSGVLLISWLAFRVWLSSNLGICFLWSERSWGPRSPMLGGELSSAHSLDKPADGFLIDSSHSHPIPQIFNV